MAQSFACYAPLGLIWKEEDKVNSSQNHVIPLFYFLTIDGRSANHLENILSTSKKKIFSLHEDCLEQSIKKDKSCESLVG
jgi:hypothetical protein